MNRQKRDITITVVGDEKTGKTTLISSLVSENFSKNLPGVLQPVIVPSDVSSLKISFSIVDTSSSAASADDLNQHLRMADAVVIVCSSDVKDSYERITSHWLPLFKNLSISIPVVIALNKSDLTAGPCQGVSICEKLYENFLIEAFCECSARTLSSVPHVFYLAQRAVLSPIRPLFDIHKKHLTPPFVDALSHIFKSLDKSLTGVLTDEQLDQFQSFCFNRRLYKADIADLKTVLKDQGADSVDIKSEHITFAGFCRMFRLFIEQRRADAVWIILEKYGFGLDLKQKQENVVIKPTSIFSLENILLASCTVGVVVFGVFWWRRK